MLRVLHTSDWHLGKKLFKEDRIPEQKLFLNWLLELIQKESINVLLICGDIFDTHSPPHEAQIIYYEFLYKLKDLNIHVIIISGNHDSGPFLSAPAPFLKNNKISVFGQLASNPKDMLITIGNIHFVAIPYFRSFELFNWAVGNELELDRNDPNFFINALKKYIQKSLETVPIEDKKILLTHHLFGMYTASGSETVISLSGLDSIPPQICDDQFDYVALGHIHKPQWINKNTPMIYYSGSPIPMRFSETEKKTISLLNIENDTIITQIIEIPKFRNLISIKCDLEKLDFNIEKINTTQAIGTLENFVELTVTIPNPKSGLLEEIQRKISPSNKLLLTNIIFPDDKKNDQQINFNEIRKGLNLTELFSKFYKEKYNTDSIPEVILSDFKMIFEESSLGD